LEKLTSVVVRALKTVISNSASGASKVRVVSLVRGEVVRVVWKREQVRVSCRFGGAEAQERGAELTFNTSNSVRGFSSDVRRAGRSTRVDSGIDLVGGLRVVDRLN
jgi:hypothetical protein